MFCEVWFAGLGRNLKKKSGRKMIEVVEKTWNLFVFSKRSYCQDICKQKSEEQTLASFSSCIAWSFYPTFFLQQFVKLMSKLRKMMDIVALPESSILSQKPSEWLHLLFKWFTFWLPSAFTVFDECVLRIWTRKNSGPSVYRPPKFWHKNQDSEKSVDFLLNRSRRRLKKSFLRL